MRSAEIRALRPPKPAVDPWRPLGVSVEEERQPGGALEPAVTVFLAGSECPFTCVFCDLWRHTIDGPTPPGAIPAQLDLALEEVGSWPPDRRQRATLKLYNASNFFDPRAVPAGDWAAIAARAEPFGRVTVECHPRLLLARRGAACEEFARGLAGRRLEVALGLETVHPGALARLNKEMSLADFDRAAEWLHALGLEMRAFVLVGAPYVPAAEVVEWAVRSAEHALARGARIVSLVPLRRGQGALDRLAAGGEAAAPTLADLEAALDRSVDLGPGVVLADLWEVEQLAACASCRPPRLDRLERLNRTGRRPPPVTCAECGR